MKRIAALFLWLCLLAGCGGEATPAPDLVATRVAVELAVAGTLTAQAPTATNTPTTTPKPTATRRPFLTATPEPYRTRDASALDRERAAPSSASFERVAEFVRENSVGLSLSGAAGLLLGFVIARIGAGQRNRQLERTAQERLEELEKNRRDEVKSLRKAHQAQIDTMKRAHQAQTDDLEKAHQVQVHELTTAGWQSYEKKRRENWFEMLRNPPWTQQSPEVEIEVKFVFQLLKFLDYQDSEMELRTPILVQHGTTQSVIQADVVVRDASRQVLLVVEAKAPGCDLDEVVRKQAQSYAFQLSAPVYILTNGCDVQIYHRGVLEDKCVLSCRLSQLEEQWEAIEQVAGKQSVAALRSRLSRQQITHTGKK